MKTDVKRTVRKLEKKKFMSSFFNYMIRIRLTFIIYSWRCKVRAAGWNLWLLGLTAIAAFASLNRTEPNGPIILVASDDR